MGVATDSIATARAFKESEVAGSFADKRSAQGIIGYRRPIVLVFLPFAGGYFLSYFYRTINAVISAELSSSMHLRASDLGLLTAVYFLAFAAMQLPVGIALDRFGPRRVQGMLLLVAAIGAALFGTAQTLAGFIIGRALIGLGVAAALIAGLKSIRQWFPKERLALLNGCFIMVGTLGALTATAPAELIVAWIGWRALFAGLAVGTAACAIVVVVLSPEPSGQPQPGHGAVSLKQIYTNARFWRVAPLSTMCISTAWALQGLWAGPWLADVENLGHPEIVQHLFVMAIALCAGALLLGILAERLRRHGVRTQIMLAAVGVLFIAAELALILRLPVPSYLLWAIVGSIGAATVLSFTILADYFPSEIAGQANAALNILHIGGAFILQYAIGIILDVWGSKGGHYPTIAYQAAFTIILCLQVIAWSWFFSSEFATVQRPRAWS
jgi:MFS family permease